MRMETQSRQNLSRDLFTVLRISFWFFDLKIGTVGSKNESRENINQKDAGRETAFESIGKVDSLVWF